MFYVQLQHFKNNIWQAKDKEKCHSWKQIPSKININPRFGVLFNLLMAK